MPLAKITKFYGVRDAKLTPMLTDPAGGPATYGTAIDVPGIQSVLLTGTVKTVKLRGDHQFLDSDSILESLTATFNYSKESLTVRAAAIGGTVSDTGTTPNQITKWRLLGTDTLFPYYKFEALAAGVDLGLGDGHLVLYKCKSTSFPPMGLAEEDYHRFNVEADVYPRVADSFWVDEVLNETAAAIV